VTGDRTRTEVRMRTCTQASGIRRTPFFTQFNRRTGDSVRQNDRKAIRFSVLTLLLMAMMACPAMAANSRTTRVGKTIRMHAEPGIVWNSSNDHVATIVSTTSDGCRVRALRAGRATVCGEDPETGDTYICYLQVQAAIPVTIVPKLESEAIPGSEDRLYTVQTAKGTTYVRGHYEGGSPARLLRALNAYRKKNGMGTLTESKVLVGAAKVRAVECAVKFSHTRPDGTPFETVSKAASAENLARGYEGAANVVQAFSTSDSHRTIMLSDYWSTAGCANFLALMPDGEYQIFTAQEFGMY